MFREKHVERLVVVVSIVLAAIFLVGAIVALYLVNSDGIKLALVGVFTLAFAASVGMLTSVKRSELFGATAA